MTTWLPLESNPEVLNNYLGKLGVSPLWNIVDIYGVDDELLAFVPSPLKSLIFLFPCSDVYEEFRAKEDEELKAKNIEHPKKLFYTRQYVHNACGTIALVHAILNNPDIELEEGGVLKKYYDATKDKTPEERGKVLEHDAGFIESHESVANEGQTPAPDINIKVFHHFVAFVHFDGKLYELDGRKNFPVIHGETNPENLLQDAIAVCKKYIARDPNEVRFSLLGLVPTQ
ncbi:ubiquitin carboxyl-terminal hydrolase [Malaya genurostris]|uniref:ubiquitin carboxyl-terminal hydrolase n=1 Tax=Malaya genurostris TaxID=325434 RepID=UPI0026F387B2|nr:ubiquitin carboxyl-terminal hydrolase [Malaya genurostris]